MAITLSAAYLAELKKGNNQPNIIFEVVLDSGTVKWGQHTGNFADVLPIIGKVTSLQNKLDVRQGYTTRGELSFTLVGRDNFKTLISGEFLKNRAVTRKEGFVASGFAYTDYADTFTGKILDWKRSGDELTIIVGDQLRVEGKKKIPVENATKTQFIDYRNTNPVDIMQDVIKTQLGVSTAFVDDVKFDNEQSLWLNTWAFDRVLTKPETANTILNELQVETNSFLIHDGEKISFKHFAPPIPGQTLQRWNDNDNFLIDSISQISGYKEQFFNRVVVMYDYDESGDDKPENYQTWSVFSDTVSQSTAEWGETKTKEIRSKWIRNFTYTHTTNISGVQVYHVSKANGLSAGTTASRINYDSTANTLSWTAPDGITGGAVTINDSGLFQLFDSDETKWVRVIVDSTALPVGSTNDTVTITALTGDNHAAYLGSKILTRYRDPTPVVTFQLDINDVSYNSAFIKPTDLKEISSGELFNKGASTWNNERVMLTMVRPDFSLSRIKCEAIPTVLNGNYGFIAPAGQSTDWDLASTSEREYAYISSTDSSHTLGSSSDIGFVIW